MVRLNEAQAGRQAARLAGVWADLAYAAALLAWLGRPELARWGGRL